MWLLSPEKEQSEHVNIKWLYRSKKERIISGVCGGFGEHFKYDPTLVRLFCVIIAILTALIPFIVVYICATFWVPVRPYANNIDIEYQ